jgi:hypothetical protein
MNPTPPVLPPPTRLDVLADIRQRLSKSTKFDK